MMYAFDSGGPRTWYHALPFELALAVLCFLRDVMLSHDGPGTPARSRMCEQNARGYRITGEFAH